MTLQSEHIGAGAPGAPVVAGMYAELKGDGPDRKSLRPLECPLESELSILISHE